MLDPGRGSLDLLLVGVSMSQISVVCSHKSFIHSCMHHAARATLADQILVLSRLQHLLFVQHHNLTRERRTPF